jgi:uncharacterized membrane protein YbhN (UPF0104 family)
VTIRDEPACDEGPAGARRQGGVWPWLTGGLLLAVLVFVVRHVSEERRLVTLARDAEPAWLLVAALFQVGTYVCAAAVWHRALVGEPARPKLRKLVPLGLAKLFTDQAVPSAGMSGTLLVVRSLARRGIPRGRAVAAMLTGLAAFYVAYVIAVGAALVALWEVGELDRLLLILAAVLGFVAAAVPAAVFGLGRRMVDHLPSVLKRVPAIRQAADELSEVPAGSLFRPRLALQTIGLELGVFAFDAATLDTMLRAVGTPASFPVVFASFVFASVVATLTWVPGGLGTFEGSCVALLSSHGVGVEAALAATLLLRGFTFWLPMLPGLWLARREMAGQPAPEMGGPEDPSHLERADGCGGA